MSRISFKHLRYSLMLVLWFFVSTCLFLVLFQYQLNRGCWLGEWPFESGCSADRPTGFIGTESAEVYENHLIRNPGNSLAYSWIALNQWNKDKTIDEKSLEIALKTAPLNEQLLLLQANLSFKKQDWPKAAASLINLVQIGNNDAREPLLRLLASDVSRPYALSLITSESTWIDQLLNSTDSKFPINALLPVFSHGKKLGLISAETTLNIINKLQAAGSWLDAYALWVEYHGKLTNGLFNAGFDARISHKGFDWKWTQSNELRSALTVRQVSANSNSGMFLELEFSGRKAIPLPIAYQNIILSGQEYLFSGRYYTDKLQVNEGLSWKFTCATGSETWAQTEALMDTQKKWKTFELNLKVPASCGSAVLLGLETKNPGDAKVGIRGLVQFDDFSLRQIGKL